ncbi:hypothetical protein HPP92_018911 [Vanilla planifolia]|uniref:EIF3j n=1 Tax=Vanilla planifolia TaxID=51239 RepID=A0A835Q6L0_VANPL|nr:hypothetical protein HPP92_018911 [Vanilla planifolia]
MEDWEEEDFEPEAPAIKKEQPKRLWDDEDIEEEDVKESWEDEDDEATKEPKKEAAVEKKAEPKVGKVETGKKGKAPDSKTTKSTNHVIADPAAEKLRQQRLVEEADYKSTTELFSKKGDEKNLWRISSQSPSRISLNMPSFSLIKSVRMRKSYHYIGLLKTVMRNCMTSLKAADAKEIASSVTAIANEKLKAEKEANAGKKKQGAKKKQLHVEKPDDDMVSAAYDDTADDYDFM